VLQVQPPGGLDDPFGDLVAASDAAEDVEEDRDHLLVRGDHLERVHDRVGLRAAAGVEEVGGLAAGLGHHIECGHAEPGAVAEDPDVAVELHVGEALLLRHRLLRVLGGLVLEFGDLLVPEQGGVVDRRLRIERDHVTRFRDDERVDLDQGRIELSERGVELRQHLARFLPDVLGHGRLRRDPSRLLRLEAARGIDVLLDERVGILLGDLLDVYAAHRRQHHQRPLLGAVEDDRRVVLGLDLRGLLDPELVNPERPLAVGARDVHAEDRLRVLARLVGVLGHLDPAGLAAPADLDLGLDHARVAELFGPVDGGVDGRRVIARRHRDAMGGEQLFSLVFEKVHRPREPISR
jgi:hypothetical protein